MVRELVRRKVYVYLCTNAVLLSRRLDRSARPTTSPGRPLGRHPRAPRRRRSTGPVSSTRMAAIVKAKAKGFRVTTNSTFFNTDSPKTVRDVLKLPE